MAAQASWQASALLQDPFLGGLLQPPGQAPAPEAVDYLSRAKRQRVCATAPDSGQPPRQPPQQAAPAGPGPLPPFLTHPALCQQLERSGLSFAFPTETLPPSPPPVRPESPAPVAVPASASGEFQPGPGSRSEGPPASGDGLPPPPHQPQQPQQQQLAATDFALLALQQAAAASLLGPGPWHQQPPRAVAQAPQQAQQAQQRQDMQLPPPKREPASEQGIPPQQQQQQQEQEEKGAWQQEQQQPASAATPAANREQQLEEAMGAVVRLLLGLQNRVIACEAGRASSDTMLDTVRASVAKLAGVVTKLHHNAHAMLSQHHCQLQMLWEARGNGPRPDGAPTTGPSAQPGTHEGSRLEIVVLQLMQQASALGQALQEESAQRIALERRLEGMEQALLKAQGRGQG